MKTVGRNARRIERNRLVRAVVSLVAMATVTLHELPAEAAGLTPSDYRLTHGTSQFNDLRQMAVAFKLRPPRRLRMNRLELAAGALASRDVTRPFVSLGPVWRLAGESRPVFVELGFSPTLIGGSTFDGHDAGGNFHFTSSAALGTTFGQDDSIALALRIQHTSNCGLADSNPGIDMFGINLTVDIPSRWRK